MREVLLLLSMVYSGASVKCYSCATTNMKSNFLTKQRGPPNRIGVPITFDDKCVSDTWVIKDRSTVDCDSDCYKWEQNLNNSGSMSTMLFRGCYSKLYNLQNPNTFRPPNHTFCTMSSAPLSCLSDANIIEHSCWCNSDFCNLSPNVKYFKVLLISILLILIQ